MAQFSLGGGLPRAPLPRGPRAAEGLESRMVIEERLFQHPLQASHIRLAVYEQPADTSPVEGMPDDAGFLVTEEWRGSSNVVKTLGFSADRKAAAEILARRAGQLEVQRYRPVAPAA